MSNPIIMYEPEREMPPLPPLPAHSVPDDVLGRITAASDWKRPKDEQVSVTMSAEEWAAVRRAAARQPARPRGQYKRRMRELGAGWGDWAEVEASTVPTPKGRKHLHRMVVWGRHYWNIVDRPYRGICGTPRCRVVDIEPVGLPASLFPDEPDIPGYGD